MSLCAVPFPFLFRVFFKGYGARRHLHSFPTRRSSDLESVATIESSRSEADTRIPVSTGRVSRSEEHTSELQSRQYLVCRLLLEKKKKSRRARNKQRHSATQILETTGVPPVTTSVTQQG